MIVLHEVIVKLSSVERIPLGLSKNKKCYVYFFRMCTVHQVLSTSLKYPDTLEKMSELF